MKIIPQALAAISAATTLNAAVLVNPSAITYTGTAGEHFTTESRLIDGSGLSAPLTIDNYTTVTHASASAGNAWVTTQPNGTNNFYNAAGGAPSIIFEVTLDQTYGLTDFVFWGYNNSSGNDNEARQFQLEFSNDGGSTYTSPVTIAQPNGAHLVGNNATFSLGSTQTANFVRITVTDNQTGGAGNGDRVGFGELRFVAVPEPSSTALLGLGGLALILRRRK